ncbi:MAG: DUF2185 domain-containing protein [bacterium]
MYAALVSTPAPGGAARPCDPHCDQHCDLHRDAGVTRDGLRVGIMFRRPPLPDDSGWTFEGAGEDPSQKADPAWWGRVAIARVAELDPAVVPHLDAPPGTALMLDDAGHLWVLPAAAAEIFFR